MSEDKLKIHRSADEMGKKSRDRFYEWLNTNCTKAVSHEEAREITRKIKKNLGDIVKG